MNFNEALTPLELVEPMEAVDIVAPSTTTIECDTGYRCITGKVTY